MDIKEHNEKPAYLESISFLLREQGAYMRECSSEVLKNNISLFPVFLIHKGEITWGEDILPETGDSEWKIHLSTAEELIKKGIIQLEKARVFVAGFKNPEEFACLLAISPNEGAHFIFYPYP
jgi:hypothetical protein